MGFRRVLIRELDGTERIKFELERRIVKPKFEFEDEIEAILWEIGMEEELLPFLKDEMRDERKGLRRKDVQYLYGCPYCSFKSSFFHCVDLHIAFTEKCYRSSKTHPCYPMNYCIHIPSGKQFIP